MSEPYRLSGGMPEGLSADILLTGHDTQNGALFGVARYLCGVDQPPIANPAMG